jgi:ribosomal protein S14
MKKQKKKLLKELIKRKFFLKKEVKKKILKSILQNKKLSQIKRMSAQIILQKNYKIKKNNKICMQTSKYRGVNTFLFFSRHTIKKMANINELQNIKVKS